MLRNDMVYNQVNRVHEEHNNPLSTIGSHEDLVVKRPQPLFGEITFVVVVYMAQFVSQAGLGQVISVLSVLGESFGIGNNMSQLLWFPAAYSLTAGTFILGAGRWGDLYGHKLHFIAGFFWLAIWSLIAPFAKFLGPVFSCCCRALQGFGPAFLLPHGMAILARSYEPGMRKEMVFRAFGPTAPSGFIFGSLISALAAKYQSWPWGFWFMAIEAICGIVAIFFVSRTPIPPGNNAQYKVENGYRMDTPQALAASSSSTLH